jgi:hypothetical protein
MDMVESDKENHEKDDLIEWIKSLQEWVRMLQSKNRDLQQTINELKESAEQAQTQVLECAQIECQRDQQTYRWINALVVDKIFCFKKFIISQSDLDGFTSENSLGMVIMNNMKVEEPDQLPFWNAYKEIVADAIANWHTTITNDLKKVIMSMYRRNDIITNHQHMTE